MARYTDIDLLIDKVEETTWYHISKQGELAIGANSKDDIPLYRHSDIKDVLNNAPIADVVPKSEVAILSVQNAASTIANQALRAELEKAKSEVERLHGILLQFTDIVHKWGAKNNIDTSEISLVPILQEEADSIIKKANQGVAREIIDDFDEELHKFAERYYEQGKIEYFILCEVIYQLVIAKIKKKYTEGE